MLMAALRVLLGAVTAVGNQMHTCAVRTVNILVFTLNDGNDCESASAEDVSSVYGFRHMTNT